MNTNRNDFAQRIGGAPISWGVCEAPDWGYELSPTRVLAEMAQLGLTATELGPAGYLGATADAVRARLDDAGLRLIGGFLPVAMHTRADLDLADATAAMHTLATAGADVVVLAAQSADGSYDRKVVVDEDQWVVLLANLARLVDIAVDLGLVPTLHPHVGTAIEGRAAVLRVLQSSDIRLCLDTGHLLIGGTDPMELLSVAADRVSHVHLKDVRASVASKVSTGDTSYSAAVRAGLYTPLGDGDVDIAAIVRALEDVGYQGWYVLEQDAALPAEPPAGQGPIKHVQRSIAFLIDMTAPPS